MTHTKKGREITLNNLTVLILEFLQMTPDYDDDDDDDWYYYDYYYQKYSSRQMQPHITISSYFIYIYYEMRQKINKIKGNIYFRKYDVKLYNIQQGVAMSLVFLNFKFLQNKSFNFFKVPSAKTKISPLLASKYLF